MPRDAVFIDTSCLLALARRRDSLHALASSKMRELSQELAPLETSEWVLAEFLSAAAYRAVRVHAGSIVDRLRASPTVTVHPASSEDFAKVLKFFQDRADKDWSFVDCASIATCQARGISRVLTHDQHFAQAGLRPLLI